MPSGPRLAVVVPTRDEVDGAPRLVEELLAQPLEASIWILDDASTDGTVERIESIAGREPRVRLVRRRGPRGYGKACAEGFALARAAGAERIVQMDGDGSHAVAHLPALVEAAERGAGLVVGSRYRPGAAIVDWPLRRRLLSAAANRYVRRLTGLRVADCTSGYRLWSSSLLDRVRVDALRSEGYAFLVESLFRAASAGARIAEVPIVFVERRAGGSKLSTWVIVESALLPWRLLGRRLSAGSDRS
jgi:glycosyltransferase involved in cell wall biosynthesis